MPYSGFPSLRQRILLRRFRRATFARFQAFTLLEVLTTLAVCVVAMAAFFASCGQAVRIVKSARQTAIAGALLQTRMESFRQTPQWPQVSTATGITTLLSARGSAGFELPAMSESFTITPYPDGGVPLVVARSSSGTITSSGPDYSARKCVLLSAAAAWIGPGNRARSARMATLITRDGL